MWLALRPGARRDWRALLGLALLLGLMGGVVLTAAAGARRTDTAFPRLLRRSHASAVLVTPARAAPPGPATTRYFAALARLPQVAKLTVTDYLDMALAGPGGAPGPPVVAEASPDGAAGLSVDRVKVLAGRLPDPARLPAVMAGQQLAAAAHLHPGSALHLIGYPQRNGNRIRGRPVRLTFRVAAVVAFDDQLLPATRGRAEPRLLLSPAFARTPAARSFNPATGAASVVLRRGTRPAAFTRAAARLARDYRAGRMDIVPTATDFAATQRAIRPVVAALTVFAALTGLIALALLAQLLSRQLFTAAAEFPLLRALGMTRGRLAAVSLAKAAAVTVPAGLIAVAVAIAASPLMPIGPARLAEPSPGTEVNLAVLAAGLAATVILPLLAVAPAAWRAAGAARGPLG
ncbi:MAG: FtsX-like permease family protein, partial [Actinobacteria bacterium]|nr:FtsX-like permease family protein [Actinomycetota bacterium]